MWGMYKLKEIEKVQQSAARIFLGLNKFTPLLAIEGDTGWDSCQLRINLLLESLVKKDNSTLCKHVFLWDYSLCNNNWCSYVKQIFDSCNLDDFDNQSICSVDICKMKLQYIE